MDLWRIELDCINESLAPTLSKIWEDRIAKSPFRQDADRSSVAIVIDGSRRSAPIRLVTPEDPRCARQLLVIDAPHLDVNISPAMQTSIRTQLMSTDTFNIERAAPRLAEVLGPEFSFALIDMMAHCVALVRDPIGARPLYWRREHNTVAFASSRDRLQAFGPPLSISESAVAITLASGSDTWSKHELLTGFHRVPHGGYAMISRRTETFGQWWSPPLSTGKRDKGSHAETAREIRGLLEQAINSRLRDNLHVGAHVSGGIDSTGIAALGARCLTATSRKLVGAYAWSPALSDAFPDMGWRDERRRIDTFMTKEGVSVSFGGATAEEFVAFLARPIELEGTADLADEMPILRLAQADGVQIMLSGWGGDEVFSSHGFGYLSHLLATLQWDRAARWIRTHLRTLRRIGPLAAFVWWQGIHPFLPTVLYRLFDPYKTADPSRSLVSPVLLKRHRDQIKEVGQTFRETSRPNETMLRHFMAGHVTHRIETWDVWSRQYGFRYTYPLTDWHLIEKLLSLRPEQHFPDETPRGLAIEALADALPAGATKNDAANEACRTATRSGAWRILAARERAGQFQSDCPWLDMRRFRERLANPVAQNTAAGVIDFFELFTAVRVWHMWSRQEGLATSLGSS